MKKTLLGIIVLVSMSGCTATITGGEMRNRLDTYVVNTAFGPYKYAGTKNGYHYIWNECYVAHAYYLRIPINEFAITKQFPFTRNRKIWVPIEQVTAYSSDGFGYYLETNPPEEPLAITNINANN